MDILELVKGNVKMDSEVILIWSNFYTAFPLERLHSFLVREWD